MKKCIFCFLLFLGGCGGGGGLSGEFFAVGNQPPTASFIATPTSGPAPLVVIFDAAGSSDSDGSIVEYSWDFGDGQTATGILVTNSFANAGNRSFAAGVVIGNDTIFTTEAAMLGDVDGDGDLDLVTANQAQPNHLYLNDGTGSFSDAADIGTNFMNQNQPLDAILGDVNGDGAPDLIVANQSGLSDLYLNDGTGNFGLKVDIDTVGNSTRSVALGDVDSDGDLDLIAGNLLTNRLYLNDGAGNFGPGSDITSDTDDTWAMALGDVTGDGALDLIAGNPRPPGDPDTSRLYINDGTGNFGPGSDIAADSDNTFSVALGDVNGDGALDLITGNQDATVNRLYLNDGAGNFGVGSEITADSDLTGSVVLGDVDNDGDLDLVAGNGGGAVGSNTHFNRLYINDGTGNFAAGVDIDKDGDDTNSVVLGDVNGDGDLDLISGNVVEPNRLYSNIGTFTVTLTVTDDDGATASTKQGIGY